MHRHLVQGPVEQKLQNPAWHIHSGRVPQEQAPISFAILLNLVSASNAHDKEVLWGFINMIPTYVGGFVLQFSDWFKYGEQAQMTIWIVAIVVTFAIIFAVNSSDWVL